MLMIRGKFCRCKNVHKLDDVQDRVLIRMVLRSCWLATRNLSW